MVRRHKPQSRQTLPAIYDNASKPPRTVLPVIRRDSRSISLCVRRQIGTAERSTVLPALVSETRRPRRSSGSTAVATSPRRSERLEVGGQRGAVHGEQAGDGADRRRSAAG